MAMHDSFTTQANDVMAPHLAAQAAQARQSAFRQARFMHYANIIVAIGYLGFVVARILNGKALDGLAIIVVAIMAIGVASTRRRYVSAKSSLAAT